MQAKSLQHAPDGKLRQGCPPCGAVGVVAVWTADDHSQACLNVQIGVSDIAEYNVQYKQQ